VYQYLYLRVGHREEAEDLTQEVFLRVFRHRRGYRPTARFATWLFHIVRNVARNALRDRRRRPGYQFVALDGDDGLAQGEDLVCDPRNESPAMPLEKNETRQLVQAALDRLHFRHRLALQMQQYEDQSYGDIAALLALTPQAAKSLLYRARNQLRLELAPLLSPE